MMDRYDRQGKPITDLLAWAKLLENESYKRVAEDQIGPYWVSTVWLGLDHNHSIKGSPLIFETMVFGPGEDDIFCDRYSTEQEAAEGHVDVVNQLRDGTFTDYSGKVVDSAFTIEEEPTLI